MQDLKEKRLRGGVTRLCAQGANFLVRLGSLMVTNFEKILLGRFWGADAIGIYGRVFQLINVPTENLKATFGEGWHLQPYLGFKTTLFASRVIS